jgi:hypothetical protein
MRCDGRKRAGALRIALHLVRKWQERWLVLARERITPPGEPGEDKPSFLPFSSIPSDFADMYQPTPERKPLQLCSAGRYFLLFAAHERGENANDGNTGADDKGHLEAVGEGML